MKPRSKPSKSRKSTAELVARATSVEIEKLEKELESARRKAGSSRLWFVKRRILNLTKEGKHGKPRWSLLELARRVAYPVPDIEEAVSELQSEGFDIKVHQGLVERIEVPGPGRRITHISRLEKGGWVRFGVLSDTQLGNRNARLDVLNTAYDHYKKEGIDIVYHGGNLVDGFDPRINAFELLPEAGISIESQLAYAARVYPKIPGIRTMYITGECHEGWWVRRTGVNFGRLAEARFRLPLSCHGYKIVRGRKIPLCKHAQSSFCPVHGRDDLIFLGHEEADIEIRPPNLSQRVRGPIVRLIHPGGGTAYALSYKTQKLAESLQGGEKPQVQLVSHYHKYDKNYHREIWNVETGCLEDQTIFMRKLQIAAHVGYLIIEMFVGSDGVVERFKDEFKPFYDRGFYKEQRNW